MRCIGLQNFQALHAGRRLIAQRPEDAQFVRDFLCAARRVA